MEMKRGILWYSFVLFLGLSQGQLQVGFYDQTCPQAENLVAEAVVDAVFRTDVGFAAGLIRLLFHDCFVRGCDASVLIDSTPTNAAEKSSPINTSLRGFEVIDAAKAKVEAKCPGVVSCADIVAFAARDSVMLSGGVRYDVAAGRRDGTVSLESDTFTNLPAPTLDLDKLTQSFASKGLSQEDLVTLSGAHTVGRSHCSTITNRLYNFNTTVSLDPSLCSAYASQLEQECPNDNNASSVVPLDPITPNILDNLYYYNILTHRVLFNSDQTLLSNASTAAQVSANVNDGYAWKVKFAAAMIKMGQVSVLTGSSGQIRLNCSVVNP